MNVGKEAFIPEVISGCEGVGWKGDGYSPGVRLYVAGSHVKQTVVVCIHIPYFHGVDIVLTFTSV